MSTYLIGDIQGCDDALEKLLAHISFSPSRDTLYLLGDLINRGPQSAEVLRRCMALGDAVKPLLGNHDLHLLATAHGIRKPGKRDTLQSILQAPDRESLLHWVSQQPLARSLKNAQGQQLLMVHAGVLPQWSLNDVLSLAKEVENHISGPGLKDFLTTMYGNTPTAWSESLQGADRLRVIVNALTRIRFCSPEGVMDFDSSESADQAPLGLIPWFACPQRQTAQDIVAFGHWSTLGLRHEANIWALDTGCVWGGCLSALEISADFSERHIHQIHCDQAQIPGA